MTPDPNIVDESRQPASQVLEIARLLWRSRYVLLVGVLIGCLIGALGAWLTQPVYRATVVMMPNQDVDVADGLGSALGQVSGLAALVGAGGGGTRVDEAIAVLESRKFTEAIIRHHELLPKLFPKAWDTAARGWRVPPEKQPSMFDGYVRFDKLRRVRPDNKTGLVRLELVWPDVAEAATLANHVVAQLNDVLRERDIAEATRSIELLNAELSRTEIVAVREAIYRLIESNVRRRTLANVRQEYVFRVIDPAVPVDRDNYFRPQPLLYVAAGGFSGLMLGMVVVALSHFVRLLRRSQRAALGS